MFSKMLLISKSCFYFAFAICLLALGISGAILLLHISHETTGLRQAILNETNGQITAQSAALNKTVLQAVDGLGNRAERQIRGLRGDLKQDVAGLALLTDRRLASIQQEADDQFEILDKLAIATVKHTVSDVDGISDEAERTLADLRTPALTILDNAAQQSTLLGDCKEAPHTCLAPRLAGTLRAFELTSGDVSKAAKAWPDMSSNIDSITADVRKVTDKIVAPVPWYKKLESLIWPAAEIGTRLIP